MATFNVLMFGTRRSGKSSVLASMIESFEKINATSKNKIKLEATPDTKELLKMKKNKLEKVFEGRIPDEPFIIYEDLTDTPYEYEFLMTAEGSKDSHTISFKDIPGEWLMTDERKKELDNDAARARIIIIAIDTPHLMEAGGAFHDFNLPTRVYDFLRCPKGEKDIPRMILFVPIKCEKYYYEGRMNEVNDRIKKQYELLFENFAVSPKKELYTVAITPILTLGGIVFDSFMKDSDGKVAIINNTKVPSLAYRPKAVYYKLYDKAPIFSPKYCEQPVLYILNFILKFAEMNQEVEKKRSTLDKVIDTVINTILTPLFILDGIEGLKALWSGVLSDTELIKNAIKATENIKVSGDGYEIIQNPF